MSSESTRGQGWVLFAAMVMIIVGGWNAFEGFIAILNRDALLKLGGELVVLSTTQWGWIHLLLGALVLLTGIALLAGASWARVAAIVFVVLNAIAQVFTIQTYPWWGLIVLVLDIFVIWALCVWRPAEIE